MSKSFRVTLGPFDKGFNNKTRADAIGPGEAQDGNAFELSTGKIKSLPAVGAPIVPFAGGYDPLWFYLGKSGLLSSEATRQYALSSGLTDYVTVRTSVLAATAPKKYAAALSGGSANIGIVAPASLTVVTAGSGNLTGTYSWAITYVTSDGLESNPAHSISLTLANQQVTLTFPAATDARVIAQWIYRTTVDGTVKYYATNAASSATSFTDNYTDSYLGLSSNADLHWGVGGSPDTSALSEDHSPPPSLTMLSSAIHSVQGGAGSAGTGIIFGAIGNRVYWSMLGFADYWPTLNYIDLPDTIESILTVGADTFVFTGAAIYRFSGSDDFNMGVVATQSQIGVLDGFGRSVTRTPAGIIFLAREGLSVFDGTSSRVVSTGRLSESFLASLVDVYALSFDNYYMLFHSTGVLMLDLSTWPNYGIIPHDLAKKWAAVDTAGNSGNWNAGLYVLGEHGADGYNDTYVRGWSPRGSATGGNATELPTTSFSLFSGSLATQGNTNGTSVTSRFYGPRMICSDPDGNLYISDNYTIRKVDTSGTVTAVAGLAGTSGTADGTGTSATMGDLTGLVYHQDGNLYFSQQGVALRKCTTAGVVTTLGTRPETNFGSGLAISTDGVLYASCSTSGKIYTVSTGGTYSTFVTMTGKTPGGLIGGLYGDVFAFAGDGIYRILNSGTYSAYTTGVTSGPLYRAIDAYSAIYYVSGGTTINRIATDLAHTIAQWLDNGATTLRSMHVLPSGDMYLFKGYGLYKSLGAPPAVASVLPWSWTTGDMAFGDNLKRKTFSRIYVVSSGTISIGVYVDGTLMTTITGSSWLPDTCSGKLISLAISSSDGTGILSSIEVQGVVINGT